METVSVKTKGIIGGKQGTIPLTQLDIVPGRYAHIRGWGPKGVTEGGYFDIPLEAMDSIATRWLAAREKDQQNET